jgi:hypothetical protein
MAAAVVQGGRVLASVVHGQGELHGPYGGVVPELASRDHVRSISRVVDAALEQAGVAAAELGGIAVTAGPGLVGSLLVGLSFAKALAYRLGIPLVGVHHLTGHLASAELVNPELAPPYLGLVISGGHTALYRISEAGPVRLLGDARDDAVGEAFDKVAAAGPAVSGGAGGLGGGGGRKPRGLRLPAAAGREPRARLLLQRPQDRGRARGRAPARAGGARPPAGGGPGGLLRAGGRRCAGRARAPRTGSRSRRSALAGRGGRRRRQPAAARRLRSRGPRGRLPGDLPPARALHGQRGHDRRRRREAAGGGERHGLSLESFSRIPIGAPLGGPAPRECRRRAPCWRGTGRSRGAIGPELPVERRWRPAWRSWRASRPARP